MKFFHFVLLLLLNLLNNIESERPKFRNDYRYEKAFNAFYKLHSGSSSWAVARVRCEAEGAELMVPASLDEADSMTLLIATHVLPKYQGVYVGVHDLYSERAFVTINGSALQNTILELLWQYEEPRHSGGRCVAMLRNGRLFVNPCSNELPFICRIQADRISYNQQCDTYDSEWAPGPGGHCYITHAEPQTWRDAYSTCLAAGGHLAVLNNRTEADYVRDLFRNVTEHRTPDNNFAFLGFSDLFEKHHFRTVHGERLEDVGFADWDRKCPDSNSTALHEQRCGGIRRSGLLNTGDCDVPALFFCEKPSKKTLRSTLYTEPEIFLHKNKRKLKMNR